MRLLTVLIVWLFFAVAAAVITPPDPISQITAMVGMFVVFGVVYFAVSRVKSFKQTPDSMKKVIVALVCLLSVTTVSSALLFDHCRQLGIKLGKYRYTAPEDPNGRQVADPTAREP